MKTSVSLPDPLFAEAEQFAHARGLSRSELYARALTWYLQTHRAQAITAALNAVYEDEESALDSGLQAAQAQVLGPEEW
jgi:metal-responsive CopG/Arc/MetJ family transcriptional regulator